MFESSDIVIKHQITTKHFLPLRFLIFLHTLLYFTNFFHLSSKKTWSYHLKNFSNTHSSLGARQRVKFLFYFCSRKNTYSHFLNKGARQTLLSYSYLQHLYWFSYWNNETLLSQLQHHLILSILGKNHFFNP